MALGVEQVEALLQKNRALAARERARVNELKAQNEDTLQEICTSLVVPTAAFGMSYARESLGEKASTAGIPIDAGLGLILKIIAGLFDLSATKGGQRVGKFLHDIANGAFASWTGALGAALGAKKRMEKPVPPPQPQAYTGAEAMPKFGPGPMTHEDLAAIKAAMSTPATPSTTPNVGAVGSVQGTPTRAPVPMDYGHIAAIAAAMLAPPPMPQQRAPTPVQAPAPPAPQPALGATQAAPPTVPPTSPQSTPGAQRTPSAPPQKPFRFTQARPTTPLPDLGTAFAGGTYPMQDVDKDLQWLSREYSTDKLDEVLRWARAPA
ncbi:MAG: hypothetical protein IPM54_11315 [Polyangiaceae bacterium]|nr:hypothetical protein [Polyangiaceae bacterium]